MNTIIWILSFVFFWLLVIQLGLGVEGLDMVWGHREAEYSLDFHLSI